MAQLPHVRIQVLPVYSGENVALGGSLTILRLVDPELSDVVYIQQQTTMLYLDKDEDVQHYRALLDHVFTLATPPAQTSNYLNSFLAKCERLHEGACLPDAE